MGALFPFSLTLESRSSRSEPPARDVLARLRTMPTDARIYQILFLGILLAAGAWLCDFSLRPTQIVLTFASAIGTQHISSSLFGRTPISHGDETRLAGRAVGAAWARALQGQARGDRAPESADAAVARCAEASPRLGSRYSS